MISIYKIHFSDGTTYVGQTRQTLEKRIAGHMRTSGMTSRVRLRLIHPDITHRIEILSRHRLQERADIAEKRAIRRQSNGINTWLGPGMGKLFWQAAPRTEVDEKTDVKPRRKRLPKYDRFPPRAGEYRCSICGQKKPHTEFYRDRTRFNGLDSRCAECKREVEKKWRDENRDHVNKYQRDRKRKRRAEDPEYREKINAYWRNYQREKRRRERENA